MMRSILTITTPASDSGLIAIEVLRVMYGLQANDASKDVVLNGLSGRVAALICSHCNVAIGNGADPSLRQETMTETFYRMDRMGLVLSRRHHVEIISILADDVPVTAGEYFLSQESGVLRRIVGDCARRWCARKIVVVYKAGFADVPEDLAGAAADLFRLQYLDSSRDPTVKSVEIPDVEKVEYWVGDVPGQASKQPVPPTISAQLKRYRNARI